MRRLALWTIVVILVLVFYYSFYGNFQRYIAIYGDKTFQRSVEEGLGLSHVRFVVKNSGKVDAIFDESRRTCEINKTVYHLDWKRDVKDLIFARFGSSVDLLPVVGGKIDRNWKMVYAECGKMIKGKLSELFENGWLVAKIAILSNGKILAYYDPITDELLEPER